ILFFVISCISLTAFAQNTDSTRRYSGVKLVFPDSTGWNLINEDQEVSFQVGTTHPDPASYAIEGAEELNITFDSLGNFYWKPSFDLVGRVRRMKDYTVIIEASWPDLPKSRRVR